MSLFAELKRRNVFRVAAAYVVTAWLVIQVVETILPAFGYGDTAVRYVTIAFAVGLIPVLALSWVFEWTPEGFKREAEVDDGAPASLKAARRFDRMILVVLALALGYFAFDKFVLEPQREAREALQQQAELEEAREEGRSEALVESYGDKSIAVLPFRDMSPERDQEYFSEGIAEELLNLLAQLRDLRVISRSSSWAVRDAGLSTPELADRLDVAYVLEGSVRKAGNTVRITAQLIEARSDTHLWSQTYDRTLDDIFAIQDEISAQVVRELQVRLRRPAPLSVSTTTPAFDLYLQGLSQLERRSGTNFSPLSGGGLHLLIRRDEDTVQRAIELFEQAIKLDPAYVPAHASLALAHVWNGCGHRRCEPDAEKAVRHREAEAAANRALELDPENSDALSALGWVRYEQAQVEESRALLERAVASNPNNALAYRWLGITYQNEDAVRHLALIEKAYSLNPLDPTIHFDLSIALHRFGRDEEAWEVLRNRHAFDPGDGSVFQLAALIYWDQGRLDLALKSYYRAYRADPGRRTYLILPSLFLELGERELAVTWLEEVKQKTEVADYGTEAIMTFLMGDTEEAVRIISADYEQWQAFWIWIFTGDVPRVRSLYEQGFANYGRDISLFDPALFWPFYIQYSLVLQRSGEAEKASELNREIQAVVDSQYGQGVKRLNVGIRHLALFSAQLHAMKGETRETLASLRRAVKDGFACWNCVRLMHYFDSVREDPAFEAFVEKFQSRVTEDLQRQHRRLVEEGMLLTPEEVLALENFDFDPFIAGPGPE